MSKKKPTPRQESGSNGKREKDMPVATKPVADKQTLSTEKLISAARVAAMLSVCPQTVYRWIRHGKLRAWWVGGCYRILFDDAVAVMQPANHASTTRTPYQEETKRQREIKAAEEEAKRLGIL